MSSGSSAAHIDHTTRDLVVDVGAMFAGVLLIVVSILASLQGLSAIANDELYAVGTDYLFKLDMTAWGTVHLVLGLAGIGVGIGIMMRASWGQVLGLIIAGLSIVANFAFLPHYPLWAMVIIAFDGFVIWALCTQLRGYDEA